MRRTRWNYLNSNLIEICQLNFCKLKFWWVLIRSSLAQEISQSSLCFQLQSPWGPVEVIKSASPESLVFRCLPQLMSMVFSRDSKPSSGGTFRLHINCTYSSERNDEIHLLVIPLASFRSGPGKNSTSPKACLKKYRFARTSCSSRMTKKWSAVSWQQFTIIHHHRFVMIRITSNHIVWRFWASTPGARPALVPPPVAMQCHGLGVK